MMLNLADILQLPTGVRILVAVLLWPAIWAAVSACVALAGDLVRWTRTHSGSRIAKGAVLRGRMT